MIKFRIVKTDEHGTLFFYTGRKNRWQIVRDERPPLSYANGWSSNEATAKLYPEQNRKDAHDIAKYYKATVQTVSVDPQVLEEHSYE